MSPVPPVAAALAARAIPHQVFCHAGPVHSLEQAASERGQQPEQVVRSILFRLVEGSYAMVLIAGPGQVSWPALRRHFGQSRLTLASQEEVLAVTGYAIGAVAPFGLPYPMPVLVDQGVVDQEEVSLGSGVRGVAVIMKTSDLLAGLDSPTVGRYRA